MKKGRGRTPTLLLPFFVMKKIDAYVCGMVLCAFALIPPMKTDLTAPVSWWPWMVLTSGFAGVYLLFVPSSWFTRTFALWVWFASFFSVAPFISFTAYIFFILGCCFHTLCRSIKDFSPVFRMLKGLMLFYSMLLAVQVMRKDTLLNFGGVMECYGPVGQHMQSASFAVILGASLAPLNPVFSLFAVPVSVVCNAAGGFASAAAGLGVWLYQTRAKKFAFSVSAVLLSVFLFWIITSGKLKENTTNDISRVKVWTRTVQLSLSRPVTGWGVGTYRYIFPTLGKVGGTGEFGEPDTFGSLPWKAAHNCWLQIMFETGVVGFVMVVGYFLFLFARLRRLLSRALYRNKAAGCLCGLVMVSVNMSIHFPTRQISALPLLIFFLAYCESFVIHSERAVTHGSG